MCLGVPGKVLAIQPEDGILMAKVDFGGVARKVCIEHVPDVAVGEYVMVHVGFALSKIDADGASRIFEFLTSLGRLEELAEPDLTRESD